MRKSTKLVLVLGVLVGLSAAVLPSSSFASTTVTTQTNNVSLTLDKVLALTVVGGTSPSSNATYNNGTGTYTGTLDAAATDARFGETTFRVTCNYLTGADANDACPNGWTATAEAANKATISGTDYATMEPSNNSNPAKIYSKETTLSSSHATWLMKVAGVSNALNRGTTATYATNYNNLYLVPAKDHPTAVATGNTFQTVNSVGNTYVGEQDFKVTYGISTGGATPADTYTGEITYTLSINPAS